MANIKKEISIDEFKAWLDGVEEMGGKGWNPNAAQWKKIRSKLKTVLSVVEPISVQQVPPSGRYPPAPPLLDPIPLAAVDRPGTIPAPTGTTHPTHPPRDTTPTPAPESADGSYISTFE